MNISIVTLFEQLYSSFLDTSLIKRARENGHVNINTINLFNYANNNKTNIKERIDAPTFGHGTGVLIKPTIIEKVITEQEEKFGSSYKIFFSPHGQKLDQNLLHQISIKVQEKKNLILLPARYEGMDARVEDFYADNIISIGDYVLMGGDLPAMVFLEGLLRLLPSVVGKKESVQNESFSEALVDYPEYTEPVIWKNFSVPEVLRSGNHKEIEKWRKTQAIYRTVFGHFEWLRTHISDKQDIKKCAEIMPCHYAILMHSQVLVPDQELNQENLEKNIKNRETSINKEGTSSVTSLDVHDIARSAKTYGIKKYFIVTPLKDQQKIINKLIGFWQTDVGLEYNSHRHEALSSVIIVDTLEEAINIIEQENNSNKPVLIATGAKKSIIDNNQNKRLSYHDQEKVWKLARPICFIFGTARGLGPSVINRSDYILDPIEGFTEFNHLSVRSAAAIIFDRWIGINHV